MGNPGFLLYWVETSMDEIVSNANGSTFLEISKGNFGKIPMLVPTVSVFNAYHGLASPPHDWVVTNEVLSRSLVVQRVKGGEKSGRPAKGAMNSEITAIHGDCPRAGVQCNQPGPRMQ